MSVKIAPEPVSVAISYQNAQQTRTDSSARAIEPTEKTDANRRDNPQKHAQRSAIDKKATPPDRPPGKDPSSVPQALFDAALIASEFKAAAVVIELNKKAELTQENAQLKQINSDLQAADLKAADQQKNDTDKLIAANQREDAVRAEAVKQQDDAKIHAEKQAELKERQQSEPVKKYA